MLEFLKTGVEYGLIAVGAVGTFALACILIGTVVSFLGGFLEGLAENKAKDNKDNTGGANNE